MIALAVLAAFWVVIAVFLLVAPDHVFRSARRTGRLYGAVGCLIFAGFCVIALLAS